MKYSTANWFAFLFFVIGAVPVATYFYLDAKDAMISFLPVIVKPVGVNMFFAACFLLLASMMASRTQEKQIKKAHFQKASVILILLVSMRVIGHFM